MRFENGEIPKRVTHNDTKCNNVLFDSVTKEPIVVIDLDTIMPGMSMYDFADAVRFIANTAVEDEPDTSKVFFDTAKFRAFANGFIGATKDSLTEIEIENLVKATFSITIELASRFLDDYITGDKYFRCEYPKHNLVRTRCQLQLAKAAVAAGIEVLLEEAGLTAGEIDLVYLAGGFGSHLDPKAAAAIGMLPEELAGKTVAVGNSALAGAAMALLDGQSRKALDEIQNQCKYIELSGNSRFNAVFPQHMMFCEEDELEWN